MKNIFVGNLDVSVTEQRLRTLFEGYGAVHDIQIVRDRDTQHSRGFAFVEMANDSEADSAIQNLNGSLLDGRALSVNEARAKREALNGHMPPEQRKHDRDSLSMRGHRRHRY